MSDDIKATSPTYYTVDQTEMMARVQKHAENAQWLRFAEATCVSLDGWRYVKSAMSDAAESVADFADAMLAEAKRRGRM